MSENKLDPIPAPLKEFFEQLKLKLTKLSGYSPVALETCLDADIEELQDLLGELYYAVEHELSELQDNQLEEHVFYLEIPTTLDYDNELYAEELEQLIAKHGIEKITHHLRSL